ncbi:DUF6950 family protein [Paenirhodobacter populi]|uniref:DUF6950 domain-containing protein n=1 Tax=Paenirhodobacter populi TaxID=2306993 RepID=A0A443JEI8_9RHOB|nr:hypothetical protein [Sinirhodobacter populi]RWR18793.1 hypothetical protein D2T30_15645 [Sinirhodobacter populi]
MTRIDGWETILVEKIEGARRRPFSWGAHDCATWAMDVRAALTGLPSAAEAWRGQYSTARGARRWLKRHGWRDLDALAAGIMGDPLPRVLAARRGDVVMFRGAMGICIGELAAFAGPEGFVLVPLADCQTAWRA